MLCFKICLRSSWYWFIRHVPQEETGQGRHRFAVSPSTGGHLFQRIPLHPLLAPVTGKSHSCLLPVLLSWALPVSPLSDQSRDETESPFSSSGTQPGGKNLAVYQSILPLLSYWCSLYLGRRLPQGVEVGWGGGWGRLDRWGARGYIANGSKVSGIDNVIKGEAGHKRACLCSIKDFLTCIN